MDELFKQYNQAFDLLDARAIADLYMLPCAASDGDGAQVFTDRDSLIGKFTGNCKSLLGMGYRYAVYNILDVVDMDATTATAILGWRVYLDKSELEFRTLYVCQKHNGKWRIFSANVYQGSF